MSSQVRRRSQWQSGMVVPWRTTQDHMPKVYKHNKIRYSYKYGHAKLYTVTVTTCADPSRPAYLSIAQDKRGIQTLPRKHIVST